MTSVLLTARNKKLEHEDKVAPLLHHLSNAENICITDGGRVFVTGGQTVAEIVSAPGGSFKHIGIPIQVEGVPEHCMTNGIAIHGDCLYLACACIHRGKDSLLPSFLCDVSKMKQTGMGLVLTYLAAFACPVESYIVGATVKPGPVKFTQLVTRLPDKFLANGLCADEKGEFLYVANSAPDSSAGIYRVPTVAAVGKPSPILWCSTGSMPNGVKVLHDTVYFTGNSLMPIMSAVLGKVPINGQDGRAGAPVRLYTAVFSIFDDFDMTDNGFVIAHFADYKRPNWPPRYGTGLLRFCDKEGSTYKVVDSDGITHPSAVAVVRKNTPMFNAGDIVVTDKGDGRVILFKPDQRLRVWLQGRRPDVEQATS